MIHRAPFGSLERSTGILIVHYAGDFPLWLAPRQVMIIPISDDDETQLAYAEQLRAELHAAKFRVEIDDSRGRMQAKIRDAELHKIPVMLIVGKQEAANGEVSVRLRSPEGTQERKGVKFDALKAELIERRDTRA